VVRAGPVGLQSLSASVRDSYRVTALMQERMTACAQLRNHARPVLNRLPAGADTRPPAAEARSPPGTSARTKAARVAVSGPGRPHPAYCYSR
jgi:hypothetical protein